MKKMTINSIKNSKGDVPLVMITAYDALFAQLFEGSCDMILVGDSLNMSFGGKSDTLSATLEQMIYHTQAVCKGAKNSFIVTDMPFGTYTSKEQALHNAIEVFQKTNADAVKIEGGVSRAEIVHHLTQNGVAVCGHIGLLPQSVRGEGGYIVRGKDAHDALRLIEDARAIEDAGAFCIVVEGVKPDVACEITNCVKIPVIGIGSGVGVDGQVLVFSDMLGLYESFTPKFVKKYLDGAKAVRDAISCYALDVRERKFPESKHTY